MISTFRALHHRNFTLLLSGQTLSRIGDFLFQIALAWWVLEKTGSAVAMGTVLIFAFVPMLLFVLIGGVAVDRLQRTRLLLWSDIGRGIVMAVLTWLVYTGQLEIWIVYIGAFIFGFADAFFQPAYQALIPQITPQEDWPSANSLSSLSMQLGRVIGPALGGIMSGLGGTVLAFGLNAASFFISAILLLPLLSIANPPRETLTEKAHMVQDFREGLQVILTSPFLWITILVAAFVNITISGPYSVGMPFLVKNHLGGDEKLLGIIYSIFPIGYIIASLVLGSRTRLRYRGITFYLCAVVAGLGLGVFGLHVPFPVLVIAAVLNGATLEIDILVWTNAIQEMVPPEKMGRVYSLDMLGSFVLLPIGYAVTGWLIEQVGAAGTFIAAGYLTAIISLLALLHPAIRGLD